VSKLLVRPFLQAVAHDRPPVLEDRLFDSDIDWLLAHGLGPLVQWLTRDQDVTVPAGRERLRGAELAARVTTAELVSRCEDACAVLWGAGIRCTVLKGISYAERYYPAPHLRTMGDIDLLIGPNRLQDAESVLLENGFVYRDDEPADRASRHHGPPLRHAASGVVIELHRALQPQENPASREAPLNLTDDLGRIQLSYQLGNTEVSVLRPEAELMLLAAGWCRDLRTFGGLPGLQRPLFDTVFLIRGTPDLDWDVVLDWAKGTFGGACLAVLLSTLDRHGAFNGPQSVAESVVTGQPFVDRRSLTLIHEVIDRHVLSRRPVATVVSPGNAGIVLRTLIAPRPAWRNQLSLPGAILFPPGNPDRWRPGFQLRRLLAVLRKPS
jgi:Uncharacterised nucleotidyltransferase